MNYQVTRKYVPPAGQVVPGEHYTLTGPSCEVPWFRTIYFFRTGGGREIATDSLGHRIAEDGDLFRMIKAAVQQYDRASSGG